MPALKPPPEKRPCEGCVACCEFLWVEEVDSPTGQPCRHQCRVGCAIFGQPERPPVCNGFYCLYAMGDPNVPHNPKDCGVMVFWSKGKIVFRELEFAGLDHPWIPAALQAFWDKEVVLERLETR